MTALGYSQTNPSLSEHDRDASNPGIKNGVFAATSTRSANPPTADAHDGLAESRLLTRSGPLIGSRVQDSFL